MARHKNSVLDLPDIDANGQRSWDSIKVGLLMDIRDELQTLNNQLRCSRIQRMFSTLERVDKRLAKKIPLR